MRLRIVEALVRGAAVPILLALRAPRAAARQALRLRELSQDAFSERYRSTMEGLADLFLFQCWRSAGDLPAAVDAAFRGIRSSQESSGLPSLDAWTAVGGPRPDQFADQLSGLMTAAGMTPTSNQQVLLEHLRTRHGDIDIQ